MRRIQLIFCRVGIDGAFGATAGGGAAPHTTLTAEIVIGRSNRIIRIFSAQSIDSDRLTVNGKR